jgi:parvulin-like peptidyl-prolyl isomerase
VGMCFSKTIVRMKYLGRVSWFACALFLTGCNNQTLPNAQTSVAIGQEVLARVGNREITLDDFEAELARRSRTQPQLYTSETQRRKLLEEMIQVEVLLASARESGFDRDPQIQSQINQFIASRFQEERLAKHETIPPTDEELREFYASHQHQFSVPAAVRAALIQFKISPKATLEKRRELRLKSDAVWESARATDATAFGRLAQQHSEDPSTRYQRGETGWITREHLSERWNQPVSDAVFALTEPGQTAPVIETPDGFYIVRLLEKRESAVRPFEEVREAIAFAVTQQKELARQADFQSQLQQHLQIESYPERLPSASPAVQASESVPPPVPKS